MKRLTLFFWGRSVLLGCALAGLAGMARAQTGSSATLESKDFALTMDTLRQTGSLQRNMPQYAVTFRLDNDAMLTNRSVIGLEVNFVPPTVKLTGITLYDPTGLMTEGNFESGAFATLTNGAEETFTATGISRGQTVTFLTEDGERSATPVTFSFAGAEIKTDTTYTLRLSWKGAQAPALMVFDNAATGNDRQGFEVAGNTSTEAPHMAFEGTAFINRFVLQVTGEASLSGLLASAVPQGKTFADDYDNASTSVVAEMRSADAVLSLDQSLTAASFVAASFVETVSLLETANPPAPTVTFVGNVPMTGPFSLRGGTTEDGTLLTADVRLAGDTSAWTPKSFMLRTDLRVDCHIPTTAGWFKDNVLPIASGRRVVLEPSDYGEADLPNVAFEAADSVLVLAGQDQTGDLPQKYQELLNGSSGVIAFARDATLSGADTESSLTIGQAGLSQTLTLLTEGKTLKAEKPLVIGSGVGADGTLRQHAGTLTLGDVTFSAAGATRGRYVQDVGTATMGTVTFPADGGNATLQVGDGEGEPGSATTQVGSLTGADGSTSSVAIDVFADGRLEVGALDLSHSESHQLTLRGGTLASTQALTASFGKNPPENVFQTLRVEGGGTLDGTKGALTLSAVSGNGSLSVLGDVTLRNVYNYNGTLVKPTDDSGRLTFGKILGDTGTVTLGYLGYRSDDGSAPDDAAALEAVTAAATEYRGTLAFSVEQFTNLDFSGLREVTSFPYALAFSNGQDITMRLDQYADATIRWPANPQGITLTLIESGAYGGEVTIPHVPVGVGVAFKFVRYDENGTAVETVDVPGYTRTPDENGVTDSLTWENPLFTGKSAWIDCEFNGDSYNTGWFSLKDKDGKEVKNGMLLGISGVTGSDDIITSGTYFTETGHPESEGLRLYSRPYISYGSLTYPEAFSVVLRVTTPNAGKKCILQLGANHAGSVNGKTDSLVFATGENGNHLVVSLVRGNSGTGAMKEVAEATLANATTAAHVVSVVFDGQTFRTYLDGALLTTYTPETTVELGTGLQVGSMLGDSVDNNGLVNADIWANLGPIAEADGGVLDYVRFYKGVLTEKAMEELSKAAPPVLENVRFVRDVPGTSNFGLWVGNEQNKPWTKETWNGSAWVAGSETYAEPEEGAEIRLRVTASGEHLLQVNVARDAANCFYSTDRLYSTLVVEPKNETTAGTVRLVPVGVTSAEYEETSDATAWITGNAWYTTLATGEDAQAGAIFHYGRLRFLGGAEDVVSGDTTISKFYGAGYLLPSGATGVTGIFDAGVCWFSELAPFCLKATSSGGQPNVLQLVAGLSLTRGVEDEAKTWQLTGPVTVEGTLPEGTDPVQGNTDAGTAQASQDVWVATASDTAKWTFFDRTLTEGGETNGNGATKGLFAQGLQTPGRLYLDLTDADSQAQYQKGKAFSAQKWYRYGYPGAGTQTPSGMEPAEASASDFEQAIAFQVRLAKDATLNVDAAPTATVQTFYVEPATLAEGQSYVATAAETGEGKVLVPTLKLRSVEGTTLAIQKTVVASARLDVANGGTAADALALPEGIEIHRGQTDVGAYVAGRWEVPGSLEASSVPRLEVAASGTLTFAAAQDFSRYETALAAHRGATLTAQTLTAASLSLAEGATFDFSAAGGQGVTFSGAVALEAEGEGVSGPASLQATLLGGSQTLTANGGICGPTPSEGSGDATATLVVKAEADREWRVVGTGLRNLALTKTGAGTVDFYDAQPPSVEGGVDVREGTLKVGTQTVVDDSHAGPAIGHSGLHVAAGATLAKTATANDDALLACIPDGQTLSGAGTIDGFVRLCSGATYDATDEREMAVGGVVIDSRAGANVTVKLPETYKKDTVYLTALRSETMVRRRFNSQVGGTRWDTIAKITNGATTEYSARPAGVPVPSDPSTGTGNVYDGDVADLLTRYYRDYGVAYLGSAEGFTKAKTYALNAGEIGNVLQCFTGVWTFSPYTADDVGDAVYVDAQKLCVAYEFGISRLTIAPLMGDNAPEGLYVIAEVKVEQALKGAFGENVVGGDQVAAFVPKVTFTFFRGEEEIIASNVTELKAFDGTVLPTGAEEPTGSFRYFAIPYTEDFFPKGTTTDLRVQVKAPKPSSAGTR